MGGQPDTVETKSKPFAVGEDIRALLPQAAKLFGQGGFSPDPYRGERVADPSQATLGAEKAIMGMGSQAPGIGQAQSMLSGLMRPNAQLSQMSQGSGTMRDLMQPNGQLAQMSQGSGTLRDLMGGNSQLNFISQGSPVLRGIADGHPGFDQFTGQDNIYRDLDAVKQNALGSAVPAATAMFADSGMIGSTTAQDAVGRAATEAVAPIEYGAWDAAQNRALSATGMDVNARMDATNSNIANKMAAIGQNDTTRMNAANSNFANKLAAIGQSDQTRMNASNMNAQQKLAAIGQQSATQMGAADMLPKMTAASYLPAQMQLGVGATQDARRQADINANMGKHYEQQGAPMGNMTNYANLLTQLGGMGGSQTQTGPGGPGTGAQIAGAGLGGLGAYGALMMNPATAPFALAGGGLSALMGLL